jgi:hypothetical protein
MSFLWFISLFTLCVYYEKLAKMAFLGGCQLTIKEVFPYTETFIHVLYLILLLHFVEFFVELYIILYCNTFVTKQLITFCINCAKVGVAIGLLTEGVALLTQVIGPTKVGNFINNYSYLGSG